VSEVTDPRASIRATEWLIREARLVTDPEQVQIRFVRTTQAGQIVIITSAAYKAPPGLPVFEKPLDLDKVMSEVERLC
jgi:hypothetical protein